MGKVKQMLELGKECGLMYVGEAYQQYMLHYDCFFSIENYAAEYSEFVDKLVECGLVSHQIAGEYVLNDMTIEEALSKIGTGE